MACLAVYYAVGLGVAGGAYLRETGKALVGEAEWFWLWTFLLVSIGLATWRSTRRVSLIPLGTYIVGLGLSYLAGHHWGNFIGWHPD